jgi:hypothetical protein
VTEYSASAVQPRPSSHSRHHFCSPGRHCPRRCGAHVVVGVRNRAEAVYAERFRLDGTRLGGLGRAALINSDSAEPLLDKLAAATSAPMHFTASGRAIGPTSTHSADFAGHRRTLGRPDGQRQLIAPQSPPYRPRGTWSTRTCSEGRLKKNPARAPASASIIAPNGAAPIPANSMTLMSLSGPGMVVVLRWLVGPGSGAGLRASSR